MFKSKLVWFRNGIIEETQLKLLVFMDSKEMKT